MLAVSCLMVLLHGFEGAWALLLFRYLLLFSSIIPISLRVNLDMAKTVYAQEIMRDPQMPGAIVRSSQLPEELGRIGYLLTDKTVRALSLSLYLSISFASFLPFPHLSSSPPSALAAFLEQV